MIQENVKVIVVDDNAGTSMHIKEMIQACDNVVVLGGPAQSRVFELHNRLCDIEPMELKLKAPLQRAAYRKFIKRDKRKNFKVNK